MPAPPRDDVASSRTVSAKTGRHRPQNGSPVALLERAPLPVAMALFVAIAAFGGILLDWRPATLGLVAWNTAVGTHLLLTFHLIVTSDSAATLRRARRRDERATRILVLAAAASAAGLVGVFAELAGAKDLVGPDRYAHFALAGLTVASSWLFIQVMFAIHYAHMHAIARADGGPSRDGGIHIPGAESPDYWDFLYVAVAIGTSGQTADVEFTGRRARRVALGHSVLAFFFNTTILALTINIAAGLA